MLNNFHIDASGKGFVLVVFSIFCHHKTWINLLSFLYPCTSSNNQSFYGYPGSLIYLSCPSQLPKQTNNLLFTWTLCPSGLCEGNGLGTESKAKELNWSCCMTTPFRSSQLINYLCCLRAIVKFQYPNWKEKCSELCIPSDLIQVQRHQKAGSPRENWDCFGDSELFWGLHGKPLSISLPVGPASAFIKLQASRFRQKQQSIWGAVGVLMAPVRLSSNLLLLTAVCKPEPSSLPTTWPQLEFGIYQGNW